VSNLPAIDLERKSLKEWPSDAIRKQMPSGGGGVKLLLQQNYLRHIPDSAARALTQVLLLNVAGNQLDAVNPALAALTQLRVLDLSNNQLVSLPPALLPALRSLRFCGLEGNALVALPELHGDRLPLDRISLGSNQLRALPTSLFAACRLLRTLDAPRNFIVDLPPEVALLAQLARLDLSANMLTQLPAQLGACTALCTLLVGLNQLQALPSALAHLTRLELLGAGGNRLLGVMTGIGALTNLQRLELQENLLTALPPELALLPLSEAQIDISGNNKLVSPPPATVRAGKWLAYLRDMLQQAGASNRAKVMLVGKENVGKTSLREAFTNRKKRSAVKLSTDGIDIETVACSVQASNGAAVSIRLNVWDFAGQDIYYTSHELFLSDSAVYLVVWDARYDFDDAQHNNVGFWLRNIVARAGRDVPIIVVATHIDHASCTDSVVNAKLLQLSSTYAAVYPNIRSYRAVSTIKGDGIEALLQQVGTCVLALPGVGAPIPAAYLALEEMLANLAALLSGKKAPALTWDEWQRVARRCSITDDELLRRATLYLHSVGSIIFFEADARAGHLVVVEPQWLTKCVATILTTKHRAVRADGVLTSQMLQQIWRAPDYPPELHGHLRALLERFEVMHPLRSLLSGTARSALASSASLPRVSMRATMRASSSSSSSFEAAAAVGTAMRARPSSFSFEPEHSDDYLRGAAAAAAPAAATGDDYLVVAMLPDVRPVAADQFMAQRSEKSFTRLFAFDFLPMGLLSRFLIRCADLASIGAYWRHGFMAARGSTRLLVEVRGDVLAIRTRGTSAAELLRECTSALQSFVSTWFKVPYKIEVECVHCLDAGDRKPFLFPLQHCESVVAGGKSHVMCRGNFPVRVELLVPDVAMSDLESARIRESDLEIGRQLGSGSYGTVCAATYQGRAVAVKVLQATTSEGMADFRGEVWCLAGLDHPNIVNLIGFALTPPMLVIDLARGGDLFHFLHEPALAARLDVPLQVRMAYEIALGMRYLHSATPPILHRDLKSPNVLVTSHELNEPTLCKISDFGLAGRLYAGQLQDNKRVANPTWVAPEIMSGRPFSPVSDVYSFGILLWELFSHEMPFEELNIKFMHQLEDAVRAGARPTIPASASNAHLAALMQACWHQTPEQRPSFSSVCQVLKDSVAPALAPGAVLVDMQAVAADGAADDSAAGGVPSVAGELVRQLVHSSSTAQVCTLAYVAQARQVWGGCSDGTIVVWSMDNGTELSRLTTQSRSAVQAIRVFDGAVWCSSGGGEFVSVWRANMMVDESLLRRSGTLYAGNRSPHHCVLDINRLVLFRDDRATLVDEVLLGDAALVLQPDSLSFLLQLPGGARNVALQCSDRTDYEIWTSLLRDAINAAARSVAHCLQSMNWRELQHGVKTKVLRLDAAKARGRANSSAVPMASGAAARADVPLCAMAGVQQDVWVSGNDCVLRVFDRQTRAPRFALQLDVSAVAASADVAIATLQRVNGVLWIAVGSVIVRLDVQSLTLLDFLVGHKAPVRDVRQTTSGEVWSFAADNAVRVWSVVSGECLRRIDFSAPVTAVAAVGDALWLAFGASVDVWDTVKYVRRKRLTASNEHSTRQMVLVSNKAVWSLHSDKRVPVRVWH
jgi:small GTP-binding protein